MHFILKGTNKSSRCLLFLYLSFLLVVPFLGNRNIRYPIVEEEGGSVEKSTAKKHKGHLSKIRNNNKNIRTTNIKTNL